ncbi:MAG: hypothetical protein AAF664_17645 [Planctomycetota bacterium]
MPKAENKKQKKLAKQKQKQKQAQRQLARKRNEANSLAGQVSEAARRPLEKCFISETLLEQLRLTGDVEERMGTILAVGRVPSKGFLFAHFLVDGLCLGVKDAFARIVPSEHYRDILAKMTSDPEELGECSPALALEVLTQARDYAAQFNLRPGGKFDTVVKLLGNPDESLTEKFHFGANDDEEPRYVVGPNDSPAKQEIVLSRLIETVGEENFDFVSQSQLRDLGTDFESWSDEDDWELDEPIELIE